MSEQPVQLTRDGAVATVTLARPRAMNALDDPAKAALLAALIEVAADQAVRAVVLTGIGRAFCVGQDLREHVGKLRAATSDGQNTSGGENTVGAGETGGATLADTVREHYNPIATVLATMPKPVVAAVNGIAAGAGASFAFACDLRVVAQSAAFTTAFAAIGLSCDSGASWTLPRLVGLARATELLLMPRSIGSAEALELGLATRVVPDDELPAAAAELAGRLAAGPTVAYAAIKSALHHSQSHGLADSLAHEGTLMALTGGTADHLAAVEAFVAKRPPTFTGC